MVKAYSLADRMMIESGLVPFPKRKGDGAQSAIKGVSENPIDESAPRRRRSQALRRSRLGHDSRNQGSPSEVQVSLKKAKADLQKKSEYTSTEWSRTGYTYEEAASRGIIDTGANDYERVDDRE